jgi:hypothetical protein
VIVLGKGKSSVPECMDDCVVPVSDVRKCLGDWWS